MGGWLAGLDAFVVGLVYLGALLTTRFVVRPLLISILGSAPVIGGWLVGNLDAGLNSFERTITPAAEASLGVVTGALDWLEAQARALIGDLASLADASVLGFWQLTTVTLPHQLQLWLGQAESYAAGLLAVAEADLNSLSATLSARLDAAALILQGLILQARREAVAEVQSAEVAVLGEVGRVEQTAGQLFRQAEYDAGQLVAQVESRAVSLVAQIEADLGPVVTTIERDLKAIEVQVAAQFPEWIRTVEKDLNALHAQADAQGPELERNFKQEVEDLKKTGPWRMLLDLEALGERLAETAVEEGVAAGFNFARGQIQAADELRAKFAPVLQRIEAGIEARIR